MPRSDNPHNDKGKEKNTPIKHDEQSHETKHPSSHGRKKPVQEELLKNTDNPAIQKLIREDIRW